LDWDINMGKPSTQLKTGQFDWEINAAAPLHSNGSRNALRHTLAAAPSQFRGTSQ
jgi:hypothetical protein